MLPLWQQDRLASVAWTRCKLGLEEDISFSLHTNLACTNFCSLCGRYWIEISFNCYLSWFFTCFGFLDIAFLLQSLLFCQYLVLFQFTLFLCINPNSVHSFWGPISTTQILVYGVAHDTVDCGKNCGIGLFIIVDSLFEKEVQNSDDSQGRQYVPVEEKDCNGNKENNKNGNRDCPRRDSRLALARDGTVLYRPGEDFSFEKLSYNIFRITWSLLIQSLHPQGSPAYQFHLGRGFHLWSSSSCRLCSFHALRILSQSPHF